MSESSIPQPPNPNWIQDPAQARQEADAWKPYMELRAQAEQAGLLGAVEDLGHLATNAGNVAGAEYLASQSATETTEHQQGHDETVLTPEHRITPLSKERISEIASDSVFAAST